MTEMGQTLPCDMPLARLLLPQEETLANAPLPNAADLLAARAG
jgi:hypothetical protein